MSLTIQGKKGDAPIARVVDTQGNFYFVYLSSGTASAAKKSKGITQRKLDKQTINLLASHLSRGLTLEELVNEINEPEAMPQRVSTFTVDPGERIEIMPSRTPERVYASGPTGAGKTYVIAQYARNYQSMFPNNNIWAFVRQSNDPAFKGVERNEIVIDSSEQESEGKSLEDVAEEIQEMSLDDYSNSLIIMDDLDNLNSKTLSKLLHALCNDLMCNGRKKNIWVAYIGHLTLRGHDTKVILNECNKVFLFPSGTGKRGARNFLKEYAGLENKQIQALINIKDSRWIMVSRNVPCYIATEKSIFLL